MKLDKIDLKILTELEKDARQPITEIASKVGTSQQNISYRISALEKNEIIKQYYSVLNLRKLGYSIYRTLFRLSNTNQKKHEEIIKFLSSYKNVLWLVDVGGRADLLVNFIAKDIFDYSEILNSFKRKFPEQIQNYEILPIVELYYFGRKYFPEDKDTTFSVNKEEPKVEIDNIDSRILSFLCKNARMNSVEIAEKLKISPNTVILRIRKLKENKVILSYKPLIDLSKLNYSEHKMLIKFQNITEEKEKDIINFLKRESGVMGGIKLIGAWDFEIEFEVKNREEMKEIMGKFRDKFTNNIKEIELLDLFKEYKYNFFPDDLLD